MGIPGPDAGNGGKHLLLPPGYQGPTPAGYFAAQAGSYRVIAAVRSLPQHGDVPAALQRITAIDVHPLDPAPEWTDPTWIGSRAQYGELAALGIHQRPPV